MSVESAENSLENLENSIQIDGMLSQEEKNAFQEHFQIECGDINAETSSIIQDFLTTDLLQNIDQFDVLQQRAIRNIVEKNAGNQGETISKEIQNYFQIDIESNLEVTQTQEQLNSLGLNLNQFLEGLRQKIDQDLSFLSLEHKEKIQKSIGIKTLLLGEELSNLGLDEYSEQELLNQRWIVNGKIQDTYNFYTKELFPTLELQHKLNNGETIPTQYTTRGERQRGPSYMSRVNHSIREVNELMNAELDEDGNFDEGGFQTQRLLNSDHYGEMFSDMGIKSSENISLLSEEDQKIEGKAMLCYLAAVGLQCIPYVGAALSLPADVRDIFSSQDTTLQTLQGSNLVSSQYRMEKGPFDRIAAVIGVVFTAVGFQALAKTGKIAKAVSKISGLNPSEISSIFGDFIQSMGLSDEVGATLGNFLGLNHADEAENIIPEAANINRAPVSEVNIGKEERMDIPEELAATGTDGLGTQRFDRDTMLRNANLSPVERIHEASRAIGELSPEQQQRLLEAHDMFAEGDGSYTLRELAQKRMRLMEPSDSGVNPGEPIFTKEQATRLMDLGLAGDGDRLYNLPPLRAMNPGESLQQNQAVYIKWNDGNSYPGEIVGWSDSTYKVRVADGREFDVTTDHIQIRDQQATSGNVGDIWDISGENLPPMNTQDVSNLFTNISDQPIYRELNTLITNADITTGDGRQALKDNLLGTLKRDVDNLGAKVENNTAWIESRKSTLGDLDQSIQDQKASLSRLQEERITLITRKAELESQIAENRSGMSETQRGTLIDLEKSWNNLSHHAESVRAYATLRNLGGYEKGGDIPTELRHAQQELSRAKIQNASHELIKTPEQRALDSYNSMRNSKIDAAREIIRGDIEYYNRLIIDKFPGKEVGDLTLEELKTLAQSDIIQNMRLAQHRGTNFGPDTIPTATRLQKDFRNALGEVGKFEGQKASFITQQTQGAQGIYSRELSQAQAQTPIIQGNIVRLEQRIQALETLGSIGSQTLSNIVEFHDIYGGESRLSELRDMRNQVDGTSIGSVTELDSINDSIGNINGQIGSETVELSTEEIRRSELANNIAIRENENIRSQEWKDYYTGLGRQVVSMFS